MGRNGVGRIIPLRNGFSREKKCILPPFTKKSNLYLRGLLTKKQFVTITPFSEPLQQLKIVLPKTFDISIARLSLSLATLKELWARLQWIQAKHRLGICQKIYTTKFSGRKIYTLKVRKFRLFLLKKKLRKCIYITYFSSYFVRI